jgi:hypothetical protein
MTWNSLEVRGAAVAAVLGLASLAGCADNGPSVVRRQQTATSALPGYACAPSPASPDETICTRRGPAAGAASGPAARSGRLSRSAAVATYPATAAAARTRPARFTGPIGVILPRFERRTPAPPSGKSERPPRFGAVEPLAAHDGEAPADTHANQVQSAR